MQLFANELFDTLLQWGHGDEAVEERRTRTRRVHMSFNGATVMKPWKSRAVVLYGGPTNLLQWGHGDEAVEEPAGRGAPTPTKSRFNGATVMKPWKRNHPRP